MTPPTICTFKWDGWRAVYRAEHVNAWARMIQGACSIPYRMICFTDDPTGITECETFPLWPIPRVRSDRPQNSFLRLRLFDAEFAKQFGTHLVQMDLDCVVLRDLAPLFTGHDFRAVRGVSAPINGSMWMLRVGAHENVWSQFHPIGTPAQITVAKHNGRKLVGSDQAWMSLKIPQPALWDERDGVYQFSNIRRDWDQNARVVFFAGHAKPWSAECLELQPRLFYTYRAFL